MDSCVQEWLAKHPRFHMHFTPTSASWLNMVERFFRDITTERIRRGVFTSVPELIAAIDEYVAHHNTKPKPFIWTKSARDILAKVIRANSRLSAKQNATLHYYRPPSSTGLSKSESPTLKRSRATRWGAKRKKTSRKPSPKSCSPELLPCSAPPMRG